ncbi:MAG TPA: T9SS type A sorting domain-containing protein, partial [Flavobacteriales bacterium]|nr:T9SS type A sorting domain-containing protein [Flavobacteriales bacterium]
FVDQAATISPNTNIVGLIPTGTDVDWYKFTNSSSAPNIKVTLTGLPVDYDVKLYQGTSSLLGTSQNGGLTSEQLIQNTLAVTTYYVKVYSPSGSYSTTDCYTLRASTQSSSWFQLQLETTLSHDHAVSSSPLLGLYPNPAQDQLNVDYLADGDVQLNVEVLDLTGRVVLNTTRTVPTGRSSFALQLPDAGNGVYLLRLTDGTQQLQQRFLLQH